MSSIAIWYSPLHLDSRPETSIDLHLNLWKVPGGGQHYRRFLDVGIRLANTNLLSTLNIFVPFEIAYDEILDLGKQLATDSKLVCAIFNENYRITSDPKSKISIVTDSQRQPVFNVYELSESDIQIESRFSGTIIRISLPQFADPTYFRIRIDGKYCESLITLKSPSNSFFQSAFSKLEITDFRVNQIRDLDRSLLELIEAEGKCVIAKAHFFYLISSSENLLQYHEPYRSCRSLEKDKWKQYIGLNGIRDDEKMLAYHWKYGKVEDITILIKSKFERNNWLTILAYLFFLGILSIGFNLLASWIFKEFTGTHK